MTDSFQVVRAGNSLRQAHIRLHRWSSHEFDTGRPRASVQMNGVTALPGLVAPQVAGLPADEAGIGPGAWRANEAPPGVPGSSAASGVLAARPLPARGTAAQPAAGDRSPFNVRQQDLLAVLSKTPKTTRQLYVIDNFQDKTIPIDRNNSVGDVSHGDLCAKIAETRLGRPVKRIDVGRFDAGWTRRAAEALTEVMQQVPPGRDPRHRFDGYVFSVSFGVSTDGSMSEDQFRLRQLLDGLAAGGAQVYIAAGNDWNNTLATPRMRTVGASGGVQGYAPDAKPSAALIENPGTDQVVNGQVLAKPTYDPQLGRLTGWSINGDNVPEYKPQDMTDVSARTKAIAGQALSAALLSPAQAKSRYADLMAMPPAEARAALGKLGRNVIAVSSLDAVFATAAMGNAVEVPAGVDGRRLYVSAIGVFASMLRLTRTPEVVFFTEGKDGLQALDNRGPRLLGPVTSYSTPFAAADGAANGTRR